MDSLESDLDAGESVLDRPANERQVFLTPALGAPPSDRLGAEVADVLRKPGEQRDRLTQDLFVPAGPDEALARLERAFVLTWEDAPEAAAARMDALRVDSFPPEEYLKEISAGPGNPGPAQRATHAS